MPTREFTGKWYDKPTAKRKANRKADKFIVDGNGTRTEISRGEVSHEIDGIEHTVVIELNYSQA